MKLENIFAYVASHDLQEPLTKSDFLLRYYSQKQFRSVGRKKGKTYFDRIIKFNEENARLDSKILLKFSLQQANIGDSKMQ